MTDILNFEEGEKMKTFTRRKQVGLEFRGLRLG